MILLSRLGATSEVSPEERSSVHEGDPSKASEEAALLARLHGLWADNWPAGVSRVVSYPFGNRPLCDYLSERAAEHPDRLAYVYYGYELTYRALEAASNRFARLLLDRGVRKGDRVAVYLQNMPQFVIAFFGILKAGAVHVPVNPMFKAQELAYQLRDCGAVALVALDEFMPLVREVAAETALKLVITTAYADVLPDHPTIAPPAHITVPKQACPDTLDMLEAMAPLSPERPDVSIGLDDVAALNYTGGTTGMPKGCIHTHGDMIYTAASASRRDPDNPPPLATYLVFNQMFWIAGENGALLMPIFNGGTVILMARWDPLAFLTAVERYKVTNTSLVLDNAVQVMEHPDAHSYDLSSLRACTTASYIKKLDREYRRRWFELTGVTLVEGGWGMTETHTSDTVVAGMQDGDFDLSRRPVFVGFPVPGAEFKVCDFETGDLLPLGAEGELCVRTPSLFKGYWGQPELTDQVIRNGWFHTGDIGMIDEEGYIFFLGRRKEMLKVRGMSVFPGEVEALLCAHPAVSGAAVLGREDPHKGQVPVAFVRLEPDAAGRLTPSDLEAWARGAMATFKVPEIRFVDAFPLTATGKVKKHELAALL